MLFVVFFSHVSIKLRVHTSARMHHLSTLGAPEREVPGTRASARLGEEKTVEPQFGLFLASRYPNFLFSLCGVRLRISFLFCSSIMSGFGV